MKHVKVHPSGRCDLRRRIPKELQPLMGKTEHIVSIGRRDDAGFLSRLEAEEAAYELMEEKARRQLEGKYDELTPPLIAFLAEAFFQESLEDDEAARWSLDERSLHKALGYQLAGLDIPVRLSFDGHERERWALKRRETLELVLPHYREMKALGDLEGLVKFWRDEALELADAKGLVINPADEDGLSRLCRAINDAAIRAAEAAVSRLSGIEVPTPEVPAKPQKAEKAKPKAPRVGMLKTFDTYAAAQGMSAQVRDEWRGYIKKLKAFVGHDDLRALTADDLRRWRDHLRDEPSRTGRPRTAHTIRSKYIASVRAMLKWAVEERLVPANVATEVTVRVPKKTKLRDKDFTHEEAIAILTASLVPASKNMAAGHARARRWIPWLCAYSGGRVNEYSQLRVEDVQEIEGIWTLNITPDAGSVKTREARQVPIHEHLIAQGFLKMVTACGKGPIFYDPESQRVDGDANRHFKKVGERLATWVRKEVGITDPGIKPNHAWRHLFKTMSSSVGIEERVADAIQGHAPSSVGRTYGKVALKTKADAIAKIPRFEVPGS